MRQSLVGLPPPSPTLARALKYLHCLLLSSSLQSFRAMRCSLTNKKLRPTMIVAPAWRRRIQLLDLPHTSLPPNHPNTTRQMPLDAYLMSLPAPPPLPTLYPNHPPHTDHPLDLLSDEGFDHPPPQVLLPPPSEALTSRENSRKSITYHRSANNPSPKDRRSNKAGKDTATVSYCANTLSTGPLRSSPTWR